MKNIVIAAALVAALAAVYFFLTEAPPTREAGSGWSVPELEDFSRIDVRRGDQEIVVEREADGWKLSAPVEYAAAQRQIDRVLEIFTDEDRRLLVDNDKEASPNNLTRYGFDDEDVLHVTLYDASEPVATFAIGKTEETPSGSVRTWVYPEGANSLYRLSRDLRATLDVDLDEWRNSEVLAFSSDERDAVSAIDIAYGDQQIRLEKSETDEGETEWAVVAPADLEYDPEVIERWVRQFNRLNAADFTDELSPADAGLEPPAHRVTIHLGDEQRALAIGAEHIPQTEGGDTGQPQRYARLDDGPIVLISSRDADRWMKRTGDFRPRVVLAIEEDQVNRIDLIDDAGRIVLVRDEPDEDDTEAGWRLHASDADDARVRPGDLAEADSTEVGRVLANASEIEAHTFDDDITTADAGLESPARTVVITLADETIHSLALGASTDPEQDDGDRYARLDDGRIFVLRAFKARPLLADFDTLRSADDEDNDEDDDNG